MVIMSKPFSFLNFRLYFFLTFNVFFIVFTFVCMVSSFLRMELLPSIRVYFPKERRLRGGSGLSVVAGFSCLASSITGWCVSLRGSVERATRDTERLLARHCRPSAFLKLI